MLKGRANRIDDAGDSEKGKARFSVQQARTIQASIVPAAAAAAADAPFTCKIIHQLARAYFRPRNSRIASSSVYITASRSLARNYTEKRKSASSCRSQIIYTHIYTYIHTHTLTMASLWFSSSEQYSRRISYSSFSSSQKKKRRRAERDREKEYILLLLVSFSRTGSASSFTFTHRKTCIYACTRGMFSSFSFFSPRNRTRRQKHWRSERERER